MKKERLGKKALVYSFIVGITLLFALQFVVAQAPDAGAAGGAVRGVGQWFADFFNALLGIEGTNTNPLYLVTNLFMALIIYTLIASVVDTMNFFGDSKAMKTVFSIAVTVVAIIAIVPTQLFTVILPAYGAMGSALLTIVPFLIIFWFSISVRSAIMARMVWILFTVYYFIFYLNSTIANFGAGNTVLGWSHLFAGVAGIAMIWFTPAIRTLLKSGQVDELVTDIKSGGDMQAAVIRARTKEAKALAKSADEIGRSGE